MLEIDGVVLLEVSAQQISISTVQWYQRNRATMSVLTEVVSPENGCPQDTIDQTGGMLASVSELY